MWEYSEFPVVETTDKCAPTQGKVKISPLLFVEVVVNGKAVRALKDSGAQIPLISQNLSQEIPTKLMGRIVIDGVVGSALVPLTSHQCRRSARRRTGYCQCAYYRVTRGVWRD